MLAIAGSALLWSLHCFVRYVPLVLGLSLVPAIQRFVLVMPGSPLAGWTVVASEAVAEGARLILVAALLWIAVREALPEGDRTPGRAWAAFAAGITPRMGVFLGQFVFLAVAFAAFDLIPDAVIANTVSQDHQALATAILLAVKNLTVIALTFLWLVGLFREFMLLGEGDREQTRRSRPA